MVSDNENNEERPPMMLNGRAVGNVTGVYLKSVRDMLAEMGRDDLLNPPVTRQRPTTKRYTPPPTQLVRPPILPYEEGGPPDAKPSRLPRIPKPNLARAAQSTDEHQSPSATGGLMQVLSFGLFRKR